MQAAYQKRHDQQMCLRSVRIWLHICWSCLLCLCLRSARIWGTWESDCTFINQILTLLRYAACIKECEHLLRSESIYSVSMSIWSVSMWSEIIDSVRMSISSVQPASTQAGTTNKCASYYSVNMSMWSVRMWSESNDSVSIYAGTTNKCAIGLVSRFS